MAEPPPISVVVMMRRRLPDGYALVSRADLELASGQLPANHAAVARIRAVLDGRLTDEEQEAWDAYAAERQATAKPDSREALQALIDASTERIIREKIAESLRRAAAGRREYAVNAPDHIREELEREAVSYESCAHIVDDPRNVMDVIPSWRWTVEEAASIYPRRGEA